MPFCSTQLRELLLKYWLVYWRTPSYTLARCFLTLCVAFIYGSMYFKAAVLPKPYASMGNIQNIMGIMFSSTSFLGMTNLMAVMPLVSESQNCSGWNGPTLFKTLGVARLCCLNCTCACVHGHQHAIRVQ